MCDSFLFPFRSLEYGTAAMEPDAFPFPVDDVVTPHDEPTIFADLIDPSMCFPTHDASPHRPDMPRTRSTLNRTCEHCYISSDE